MAKKRNNEKSNYVSPMIKVLKIKVEKGFAISVSDEGTFVSNPMFMYRINKVNDGKAAW